ncbi:MAG: enoyl-CoA hydratase/isomerase family protein [Acidobacteriota bacterium]|jgi:enoyl-CoA hydratase/carnithine racemase
MIDLRIHGPVHELRLDRPPVNALDPSLLQAVAEGVRLAPEQGARALVLSGREGMFSAGLDVPTLLGLDRDGLASAWELFFEVMEVIATSTLPVAAAITGHAPAAGAILALFCDWRVMEDGPFGIGLNEVRIGIPMPDVVAALAARTVGPRRAEALCVSGRLLEPREALAAGLVDRVVEQGQAVNSAVEWCTSTIEVPPRALAETRKTLRRDLVELLRRHRTDDTHRLVEEWFRPELQAALKAMVARLKGN